MTFIRQLISAVAQLLLVVLIARTLGPEGNGQYAMAVMVGQMFTSFLNLGVGPATVYFVGRGEAPITQAWHESLKIWLPITLVGSGAAWLILHYYLSVLLPGVPYFLAIIGMLSFPISLLFQYWLAILQGVEDFKAFNAATLVPPLLTLALASGVIVATDWGVTGLIVAFVLGKLAGLVVVFHALFVHFKKEQGQCLMSNYKKRTISYGWKAHLSNIMAFVNYRADVFLVNFFLAPAATGIYVIAVQLAERLWMPSQALSTVLLPRLSAMHNSSCEARRRLSFRCAFIIGALTSVIAVAASFFLFFLMVPIFGKAYDAALMPLYWLLPGVVLGAAARILSNSIAAMGRPIVNFYCAILTVSVNIVSNVILIPVMGISGAAVATSIAYALNFAVKVLMVKVLS
ncbi:flippase [Halomonas organivorans]